MIEFLTGNVQFSENWRNRPRNLTLTVLSDTEIYVFWSNVLGATDYEYRVDGGSAVTVSDNEVTLDDLDASTEYSIEVRVPGGEWTGPETATTEDPPTVTLNAPIGLEVTATSDDAITVQWDAIEDAESYTAEIVGGASQDTSGETQATFSDLDAETEYRIRVRATSTDEFTDDSSWSSILSVFTAPETPEVQVYANVLGSSTITISKNGKVVDEFEQRPVAAELVTKDFDMDRPQAMKYIDVLRAEFQKGSSLEGLRIQIGHRDDLSDVVDWEPEFDISSLSEHHFTRFTSRFVKLRIRVESLSTFWRLGNIELFGKVHGRRF